jgi:hypothetical protein
MSPPNQSPADDRPDYVGTCPAFRTMSRKQDQQNVRQPLFPKNRLVLSIVSLSSRGTGFAVGRTMSVSDKALVHSG